MRADERQAAAAYTYAWWLTGDDDAAATAIRTAFDRLAAADDRAQRPLTVLVEGVRTHVGDVRPMCAASELALLHDGLDVELGAAAALAGVPNNEVTVQLAHGRLESLLETVREAFAHPERLGGLAVGNPPDIAHARQCPSCARARTLVERGRTELREVVGVSAPAGLLVELVAGVAPPAPVEAPDAAGPSAPVGREIDDLAPPPEVEDAAPPAPEVERTELVEPEELEEAPPPSGEELMQRPALLRPEPAAREVPTTPARRRLAGVLAGVGLLTLFALVTALFAMDTQDRRLAPVDAQGEQPAMEQPTTGPDTAGPDQEEPTEAAGFGPAGEDQGGFTVADAGLLRSGDDDFAQAGARVGPTEPLRIGLDYRNAVEGVTVTAIWRVDGEPFVELRAVLGGSSSRHVWGLPVPPDGWPQGAHRVLITTDDGLAAAIDFRVGNGA